MILYEILVQHGFEQRKKEFDQSTKLFYLYIYLFLSDESPQKFLDYRPVFFEGRPLWFQEPSTDRPIQTGRNTDERQPPAWPNTRVY
jgi:hypothetical protein